MRDDQGKVVYDRISQKSPGFFSNLRFFFTYQVGHMYFVTSCGTLPDDRMIFRDMVIAQRELDQRYQACDRF